MLCVVFVLFDVGLLFCCCFIHGMILLDLWVVLLFCISEVVVFCLFRCLGLGLYLLFGFRAYCLSLGLLIGFVL